MGKDGPMTGLESLRHIVELREHLGISNGIVGALYKRNALWDRLGYKPHLLWPFQDVNSRLTSVLGFSQKMVGNTTPKINSILDVLNIFPNSAALIQNRAFGSVSALSMLTPLINKNNSISFALDGSRVSLNGIFLDDIDIEVNEDEIEVSSEALKEIKDFFNIPDVVFEKIKNNKFYSVVMFLLEHVLLAVFIGLIGSYLYDSYKAPKFMSGFVYSNYLTIRELPIKDSACVFKLSKYDTVKIIARSNQYSLVEYQKGDMKIQGWVSTRYIQELNK